MAGKALLKNGFEALKLKPDILKCLSLSNITTPTKIQNKMIPLALEGQDIIFGDQTGTGKTFAMLLCVVHRIRTILRKRETHKLEPGSPLALVVSPTCELATQTLETAKEISHIARFSSVLLSKSIPLRSQKLALSNGPHLVVGTPGSIMKNVDKQTLKLSSLRVVAMDEVDILFDRGFVDLCRSIKKKSLNVFDDKRPFDQTQYLSCSSTLAGKNLKFLQREFPYAISLLTKEHQRPAEKLTVNFLELKGRDKMLSFLDLMENERKMALNDDDIPLTVIFSDTKKGCLAAKNLLSANNFEAVALQHEMTPKERKNNFNAWRTGAVRILVATGLACRGLDTPCEHVVLLDFPVSTSEYIHRVGRTARLGGSGRVTAFLNNSDISFAKKIRNCHENNLPIDGIHSQRSISLKMREIISKNVLDHTSEFINTPRSDLVKNIKEFSKGFKGLRAEEADLKTIANKYGVTNRKSGFKWFYKKEGSRSLREVSKSERKNLRKKIFFATQVEEKIRRSKKKKKNKNTF